MADPAGLPRWTGFQSFLQGGFECSSHKLKSGRRVDVIRETGHDRSAFSDFCQLQSFCIRTCRDGLRWHVIERTQGAYDFRSFRAVAQAAERAGTEIIWDLMHYGWPERLDIWSADFVTCFARFARAAAEEHRRETCRPPIWCPINEMSYLAWAGAESAEMNPFVRRRGLELKVQLAKAAIAAVHALRAVDPRARIVLCEPLIRTIASGSDPEGRAAAAAMNEAQFEAADMMLDRLRPDLGGDPDLIDAIGLNYYPFNQWRALETDGRVEPVAIADPEHVPLSDLLQAVHARYALPLFISETGCEGPGRASWFADVFEQAMIARAKGVPLEALCLYPVASHIGWCGERFCPNGLLGHWPRRGGRTVHAPLAGELRRVRDTCEGLSSRV